MATCQLRSSVNASASRSALRSRTTRKVMNVAANVQTKTIAGTMANLKAQKKVAFIPFLCAGDPNLDTTALALKKLDDIGADVIELGVPYSDPLADGPVIHSAATRALAGGATLRKVLDLVKQVAPTLRAPLIVFTYYNQVHFKGAAKFCQELKDAGATGLLVPDIPLEETDEIRKVCDQVGLELVLLATPTTPPKRMAAIANASQGFVYLVSVTGVTGVRTSMETRVNGLVKQLHDAAPNMPVAVGFGVAKPEQAQQIVSWGAEGVICGSALVRALGEAASPAEGLKAMEEIATNLRKAIP